PPARTNGISVPRTPTPSTARVTCKSPSDATGQDHHGSTTPHAIAAKTNPHTSTVAGSAPRRPAASAVRRYPAKKKAEATPAATPNPFSDPKPWYAWLTSTAPSNVMPAATQAPRLGCDPPNAAHPSSSTGPVYCSESATPTATRSIAA